MSPIKYLVGDASKPVGSGVKIIAHVCNDVGAWGAGFVLAISKMSAAPENAYRSWYKARTASGTPFALGEIQVVKVSDDLYVANMISQHGLRSKDNPVPLDMVGLKNCLEKLSVFCRSSGLSAEVHMPRIGAGLAGGRWESIEPIISSVLCDAGVPVIVYDFKENNNNFTRNK